MHPKKSLSIPMRMADVRASMQSLPTLIEPIIPIPATRVSIVPEDKILDDGAMIPPVQQWTSPDRVRPSPVQSSPRNFWTGLGPIPNFSGPGLNWPGLLWTSPLGPNRPEYAGGYFYTESTNKLIHDCPLVIRKSPCTPHPSPLATCHSPLTTLIY